MQYIKSKVAYINHICSTNFFLVPEKHDQHGINCIVDCYLQIRYKLLKNCTVAVKFGLGLANNFTQQPTRAIKLLFKQNVTLYNLILHTNINLILNQT